LNRVLTVVAVIGVALVASSSLVAQSDPFAGTWKLNVAKPKYFNAPPAPKTETRTVDPRRNGVKISLDGVEMGGSRIACSDTTKFNGEDSPVTGKGATDAEDAVALKRVDARGNSVIQTHPFAGVLSGPAKLISFQGNEKCCRDGNC
jgi:hypothetical protein